MTEHDDDVQMSDDEWLELQSLVERANLEEVEWEVPPPDLWERIESTVHEVLPSPPTVPLVAGTSSPRKNPRRSPSRRRWTAGIAAAVTAVAAALIAIVAVAVIDDEPDEQVLAAVDLETLEGSGSGRAELVSVDDTLRLRLTADGLDVPDGYFEVWLIDPTVTEMISLGPLRADGEYELPAGIDPAVFPVVDVSVEPTDGNPTHSGESVLRGQLNL